MSGVADLCRLVVVGPERAVDLALPARLPLADVVPGVLNHLGNLAEESVGRVAVLQRMGEPPLDLDLSPDVLGLRDGDVLYARLAEDALPELRHDDLIDGVAAGLRDRAGRWSATMTRRLGTALAMAVLALALAILLSAGPVLVRVGVSGAVAVVLLLAALAAARAFGERMVGVALAGAAVPFATLAGWLLPAVADPLGGTGVPGLVAAGAAGTGTALLGRVAIGYAGPLLLAVGVVGACATAAGLCTVLAGATLAQASAVVLTLALLFSPMVPSVAFRLAGLRLPDIPSGVDDIVAETEPTPDDRLRVRAALAEDYVTALYAALSLVCAAGVSLLAVDDGWLGRTFAFVVCLVLALRFRVLVNVWQRLAVSGAAGYGVFLLATQVALDIAPVPRLTGVVGGLVVLTCAVLATTKALPARRPRPYWGRAAELTESVISASLVPLLLAVLGAYELVRGLGG